MQEDQLTGLYNKEYFQTRLATLSNDEDTKWLFFIDLDNFKTVNDTLGHLVGDQTLKDVANILRDIFRKRDVIGRFGGDEFVVLVKNMPKSVVRDKAKIICAQLQRSYGMGDQQVTISASLGIFAFQEILPMQMMLQCADKALYYAKVNRKGSFIFYDDIEETPETM